MPDTPTPDGGTPTDVDASSAPSPSTPAAAASAPPAELTASPTPNEQLAQPVRAAAPSAVPEPWLHGDSSSLRFWVALPNAAAIGATISQATLHHRYQAALDGSNAVATYQAHREEIDAAVRRRVERGSIEPVMLREADLPAQVRR